jgi:segregation and condensation protein A
MMAAVPTTPSLANYQLRLPSFEGPLDVLLQLIERERLEISDLSLVAVTDGFLAYIRTLSDAPPALLAEFAAVASRLLLLKTRALLPRPPAAEAEPELDDLAAQLREYQRAKEAAARLRAAEQAGLRAFVRPPRSDVPAPKVTIVAPPVGNLRRALLRALARVQPEPEVTPLRPVITIGEMVGRIRERLGRSLRPLSFRALLQRAGREETVAGFIALLALWRRGEVEATQDEVFGDIHVRALDVVQLSADAIAAGDGA